MNKSFCAILFLTVLVAAHGAEPECSPKWRALYRQFKTLGPKTPERKWISFSADLKEMSRETCSDAQRFSRLVEARIQKWKDQKGAPVRERIALGFALRPIADGSVAESIEAFLGRALEENTRIFLEEAKTHSKTGPWCTAGTVANLDDYGALSETDRNRKLSERRAALQRISSRPLEPVKTQCLSALSTSG